MIKIYFIIIIVAVIFIIAVGFQILNQPSEIQEAQVIAQSDPVAKKSNLEIQTDNDGEVEIVITPKIYDKEWFFEIALNTHSEELTVDIMKAMILLDDKGREYAPLAWNGDPPGGHHRSGILRFAPISPQPASIILKIIGVGGVGERNFFWRF